MAKFEMRLNDTADHAEHDWLVFEDGKFVRGFAGSNAAERWIREREGERAKKVWVDFDEDELYTMLPHLVPDGVMNCAESDYFRRKGSVVEVDEADWIEYEGAMDAWFEARDRFAKKYGRLTEGE